MFGSTDDPNQADPKRLMDLYGVVSTLFAIVHATSEATGRVDWRLYRKSLTGAKEDRVEVLQHPALVVWNQPNAIMTSQALVEPVQQHVELTGAGGDEFYKNSTDESRGGK